MSEEPEKYIKFNEDEVVVKKEEYNRLKQSDGYIDYFKQPTFGKSLTNFSIWALGGDDFDKIFMDPVFRKHWGAMKKRLEELKL